MYYNYGHNTRYENNFTDAQLKVIIEFCSQIKLRIGVAFMELNFIIFIFYLIKHLYIRKFSRYLRRVKNRHCTGRNSETFIVKYTSSELNCLANLTRYAFLLVKLCFLSLRRRDCPLTSIHSTAFPVQHSHRSIPSAAFTAQHSQCSIHGAAFPVQHSQRSIPSAAFTAQHSQRSIHSAAFPPQHFRSMQNKEKLALRNVYLLHNISEYFIVE